MLRNFSRVPEAADPVLPAAAVVQLPVPARPLAPDVTVLPDPPAAAPVVMQAPAPAPVPKASRRRSAMSASAIPLPPADGVGPGVDPKSWLRAFDVYDERQASLFEDQGDEDGPAPCGE
ncbi:hypothetical protein ACIGXG_36255 [Streptomyces goshikiensis]|uniref:hypothetical protein n=1 Tax=Streptomyces goshikiensis TaxID=1942 RepID=UPI0037D17BE1